MRTQTQVLTLGPWTIRQQNFPISKGRVKHIQIENAIKLNIILWMDKQKGAPREKAHIHIGIMHTHGGC